MGMCVCSQVGGVWIICLCVVRCCRRSGTYLAAEEDVLLTYVWMWHKPVLFHERQVTKNASRYERQRRKPPEAFGTGHRNSWRHVSWSTLQSTVRRNFSVSKRKAHRGVCKMVSLQMARGPNGASNSAADQMLTPLPPGRVYLPTSDTDIAVLLACAKNGAIIQFLEPQRAGSELNAQQQAKRVDSLAGKHPQLLFVRVNPSQCQHAALYLGYNASVAVVAIDSTARVVGQLNAQGNVATLVNVLQSARVYDVEVPTQYCPRTPTVGGGGGGAAGNGGSSLKHRNPVDQQTSADHCCVCVEHFSSTAMNTSLQDGIKLEPCHHCLCGACWQRLCEIQRTNAVQCPACRRKTTGAIRDTTLSPAGPPLFDSLGVVRNRNFKLYLRDVEVGDAGENGGGELIGQEEVILSLKVQKVTSKWTKRQRYLVLTNRAIYQFNWTYRSPDRVILLETVESVFEGNSMLFIHVTDERDAVYVQCV